MLGMPSKKTVAVDVVRTEGIAGIAQHQVTSIWIADTETLMPIGL